MGRSAGKMMAASPRPIAARNAAGRARSPKAGTTVTKSATRAQASAHASRSMPRVASASAKVSRSPGAAILLLYLEIGGEAKSFDERPRGRYFGLARRGAPMTLNLSAVGFTTAPHTVVYDWKTVVLYALGIGAQKDELDYLYEGRGPKVYPTFGV